MEASFRTTCARTLELLIRFVPPQLANTASILPRILYNDRCTEADDLCLKTVLGQFGSCFYPACNYAHACQFFAQKGLGDEPDQKGSDLYVFLGVLEGGSEVNGEEVQLLSLDHFQQQMPVELPQEWMALETEKQSSCTFALLSNKPHVNVAQLPKQFQGQFGHFLILADKSRF